MKKHVPNFFTSLNLASGFIAIILAFNDKLLLASWLIVAAMIFDFIDGFSARLLKAYSDIGKELDSLADVVSFGVAPAILIYHLLAGAMALGNPMPARFDRLPDIILILPAIMPVFAALRLAKFNTDASQATSFKGLPTPANALAVISLVISGHYFDMPLISSFLASEISLIVFTVLLSLLMVSRMPLLSLKTTHLRFKGNEGRYILAILTIASLALLGPASVMLIVPLYITCSAVELLFH
jgi:CDP-diacylglycerol--serine O-phosphatidyltransferase